MSADDDANVLFTVFPSLSCMFFLIIGVMPSKSVGIKLQLHSGFHIHAVGDDDVHTVVIMMMIYIYLLVMMYIQLVMIIYTVGDDND